ncbi:unnamed protein product [Orchesella dallaii]|uniref:Major facilitator superfamily (MFS) profile domain-containing protein n=1 Tax=Orchesella dallaii TaxID=48710 RepID=A0ABP1RY68_9HEXA
MIDEIELGPIHSSDSKIGSTQNPSNDVIPNENLNKEDILTKPKNYDDLLEKHVGGWGPFQIKLLFLLSIFLQQGFAPLRNNLIYILDVPDHWCDVPGRTDNISLANWKMITIPQEPGPDGRMRFSQCNIKNSSTGLVSSCTKWDYDRTDYTQTVVSQNNWVCGQTQYATNCFTAQNVGGAGGQLFFGIFSDRLGRKPVFIFLFLFSIVSTGASYLVSESYWWFLGLSFMRGFSNGSVFELCSLIVTEQSSPCRRSLINTCKWVSYVVGNIVTVLLIMYLQDWWIFGWVTLGMGCSGLIIWPFLPESARWLISQGKSKEATKILVKMAKENGMKGREDVIKADVNHVLEENKKVAKISFKTVFSRGRLCFNFFMLTICMSTGYFLFDLTYLNAPRMSGYKFVNLIILFVAELLGGTAGGFLMDTLGRRWTQVLAFFLAGGAGLFCAIVLPLVGYWELLGGAIFIKVGEAIASLAAATMRDELLPTPIRATGCGLAEFVAAVIAISVPSVVEFGKDNASFPYAIICVVGILGGLAAMFLPETLNQRLPETIDEANLFSTETRFWSFHPSLDSYNSGNNDAAAATDQNTN